MYNEITTSRRSAYINSAIGWKECFDQCSLCLSVSLWTNAKYGEKVLLREKCLILILLSVDFYGKVKVDSNSSSKTL